MDKESLVSRIKEIETAVEQSVANHHGLLGRLGEAKFMLEQMEKVMAEVAAVAAPMEAAVEEMMG